MPPVRDRAQSCVTKKKQPASNAVATADGIDCLTDALDGCDITFKSEDVVISNSEIFPRLARLLTTFPKMQLVTKVLLHDNASS